MKIFLKIMHIISSVNKSIYVLIGAIVCLLTVIVFYDVVARYFFNKPSSFGYDLSIWLTSVLAFTGGGYAVLKDEHIRVDLFYERYSVRQKAILELFTSILVLLLAYVLVKTGTDRVILLFNNGGVASTGFNIPLWIKWAIVPIGGLLLGLQGLVTLINKIYFLFTGKELEVVNK